MIFLCILVTRQQHILSFSAFTFRPTSLHFQGEYQPASSTIR
jgi:hypothetical protein